jgi:hypothetical protein
MRAWAVCTTATIERLNNRSTNCERVCLAAEPQESPAWLMETLRVNPSFAPSYRLLICAGQGFGELQPNRGLT